jgi:hypothetical protein
MSAATIASALEVFVDVVFQPGDCLEVRCLHPSKAAKQKWLPASDLPRLAASLVKLNDEGFNVYVGINPRKTPGGSTNGDVRCARCLVVDFDGVTLQEAHRRVDEAAVPRPSMVVNSKGGEHPLRYREIPVSPLLFRLLRKTYESGPARFGHPDAEAQSISGVSPHNLTRLGSTIRMDAGLSPWPKLYQSLRASREQDWKTEGHAESTYVSWMGHSSKVSRTHYVRPLDSEFDAAARVA